MPVPPPMTAIGRWPARWKWARAMMPTRLPVGRLVAVGSKPWYRVSDPEASARRRGLVGDPGNEAAGAKRVDDI